MTALYIYAIGFVIALIIGYKQFRDEEQGGKNVDDAPGAFAVIAFLSWFYVLICIIRYIANKKV